MSRQHKYLLVLLAVLAVGGAFLAGPLRQAARRRALAEEVLNRYVEVTGGREAYQSIRTMVIRGYGSLGGRPMTMQEYRAVPGRYYAVADVPAIGTIEQGAEGNIAWTAIHTKPKLLTGEARMKVLCDAAIDHDIRWRDFFSSAECTGTEQFAGRQCNKIVMTPRDGDPIIRYYDVETGYLLGQEGAGQQIRLSDYRQHGGIMLPTHLTMQMGGAQMDVTVGEVEINQDIPDFRLALPPEIKSSQTASR